MSRPEISSSGTGWLRSRSHCSISAISSFWALTIRAESVRMEGLAPFAGASRAITSACAWWPIIPVTKWTSASEKRMRALSARA